MRPAATAQESSPAELRMHLRGAVASPLRDTSELEVEIIKRRGGWATEPFTIRFGDELNRMTPDFAEIPVESFRDEPLQRPSASPGEFDAVRTSDLPF